LFGILPQLSNPLQPKTGVPRLYKKTAPPAGGRWGRITDWQGFGPGVAELIGSVGDFIEDKGLDN